MVRLSELKTADQVRAVDMQNDLEYRREYERTRLANDIAIKVLKYRQANGLSQAQLARMLGMRQPNVARLEAGEHAPSLETLSRLADVLRLDFSIDVKPGRLSLRNPARSGGASVTSISERRRSDKPAASRRRRLAGAAASASSRTPPGQSERGSQGRKGESAANKYK